MKIDSDDTVSQKYNSGSYTYVADITKCTCNEITYKNKFTDDEITATYELSCNNLSLTYDGNTTKYEKQ